MAIFSLFFINNSAFAQHQFSYICEGNTSIEIDNAGAGMNNSVLCPFGCDNSNPLNYHTNAIPQADLCNPSPFVIDLYITGALIGLVILLLFIMWLVRRI
jgi:hypothetical protein